MPLTFTITTLIYKHKSSQCCEHFSKNTQLFGSLEYGCIYGTFPRKASPMVLNM